ncbi:Mss4-like protein [Xylaria sp. FL1777]|nr:Mss4-like protein [Xylaria sp. FL1777]
MTGKEEGETFELVAQCLCQAQRFTAKIPCSALPLTAIYCHCTSCRRVTGALHSTYVPWPGDGEAIRAAASSSSPLRRYVFAGPLTLLSCGVCGSTMFVETAGSSSDGSGASPPQYGVTTGVLANHTPPPSAGIPGLGIPGLLRIAHHVFVGDTLDGGATPWLCDANADGSRPRLWRGRRGSEEELSSTTHRWPLPPSDASPADETPVRCHCGGVDLVLRQPIADFAAKERSELPWFVDPVSNKSLGGFDACDSCRLSSGVDVFHWTFVLLRHLAFPGPKSGGDVQRPTGFPASSVELKDAVAAAPPDRDPRWGTLTFYESSPDVQRYFCSRCSACVFYAADDRPELVDLAIGLLDSKNGSRAEELVSWDFGGKMVWRQDVVGGWREAFVESIEAAADRWRIERGYPKNWRRIQKEEAAVKDEK